MVARKEVSFVTPDLDKDMVIRIKGEDAKPLFVDHSTRNGKFVKDQITRRIWEKHNLPMYRGTPVEEVPFQLRIHQVVFDYRKYEIGASYSFIELA